MTKTILALKLKVSTPFWLLPVMWVFIRLYSIPALFGREATDAEVERIGNWFGKRLKISAVREVIEGEPANGWRTYRPGPAYRAITER